MLASRLKRVINNVISSCQSGFISGKQILDGVLVVNKVVDHAKRRRDDCLLFKVDFEKAYDSLCWDFLFYMMGRIGFEPKWIDWMKECILSSTMSILVNGNPIEDFKMHKGLRQCDPLASFLFLIAAKGVVGLAEKATLG